MKGDFVMIYTKIKRKIAVCMSVAMLAGCVQPINIGASCKVSAKEAVGDYLVYSPSDTKLDQIADQYESKLSDDVVDIQNLQQNNILKVELTADQAEKLDQNKNVIVEKDTRHSDCGSYQKNNYRHYRLSSAESSPHKRRRYN